MSKRKVVIKIAAIFLAALMIFGSAAVIVLYADNETADSSSVYSESGLVYDAEPYDPIPLLVIKISFDADGNMKNDYDTSDLTKLWSDKTSAYYGEQYCYSSDLDWYNMLFGDSGKTLKGYYKQISDGSFWFTPAAESADTQNDGVVSVTIHQKHPDAVYGHNDSSRTKWSNERYLALQAADEYVDFASFDTDKDGVLETRELAVVFVVGGVEASGGWSGDSKMYFANHAHFTTGSAVKLDGVSVAGGSMGFIRVGEYVGTTRILPVGTVAHELGHFLGAIDVYDTGNSGKYSNMVADLSLMASGSHGYQSGERSGDSPVHMDPYHLIKLGFCGYTVATNGEYTLSSRQKGVGSYNIIRVNTPNPNEYFLIENRYNNGNVDYFDAIEGKNAGITIWHIDESVSTGNNSDKGNDPIVAVYSTGQLGAAGITGFRGGDSVMDSLKIFDVKNYKFPVSKTWYTSLTEAEASNFGLTIEVLSPQGLDMTVKITMPYTAGPYLTYSVTEKKTDGFTLQADFKTLNGGTLKNCGFIVSPNSDVSFETGNKIYCQPDENGMFSHTVSGLQEGKKYYYIVFAESTLGLSVYYAYATTLVTPKAKEYATAYLCQNISSRGGYFGVKLYPGKTLTYSLTMKKTNYAFGGWYYDEDFSGERYDMGSVKADTEDIYLYAKWIPASEAATMKLENATAEFALYAAEVGDTFIAPVAKEKAGYLFGGWFEDEACTMAFDFEKAIEEAETVSLWAKWIPNGPDSTSETTVATAASTASQTTSVTITETTTSEIEATQTAETTDSAKQPSQTEKVFGTLIVILLFGGGAVFFSVVRIIHYRKYR